MRKVLFILSFLLLNLVYAQTNSSTTENLEIPSRNWTFGVKAGLNYTNFGGTYTEVEWVDEINGLLGIHGGAWANYALSDKFALQAELLGSLQGGVIKYEEIPNPLTGEMLKPEGRMRLPYLALPVLFQYKPNDKLYFETGPQINYLLTLDIQAILNGEEVNDPDASNLITNRLENVKDFDFGWNIGAGYEFLEDWNVYIRYTHGLNSVDNREVNQRELKNRVVALGVMYEIKFN